MNRAHVLDAVLRAHAHVWEWCQVQALRSLHGPEVQRHKMLREGVHIVERQEVADVLARPTFGVLMLAIFVAPEAD